MLSYSQDNAKNSNCKNQSGRLDCKVKEERLRVLPAGAATQPVEATLKANEPAGHSEQAKEPAVEE